ncbi:Uncharacterized protein HZ326_23911 [Fusarium oxysporum f. sp. albedinis]|nr:Uncharacterized protein HZ326_23911 [Fusarium oxysporum f. sp. albedinis]
MRAFASLTRVGSYPKPILSSSALDQPSIITVSPVNKPLIPHTSSNLPSRSGVWKVRQMMMFLKNNKKKPYKSVFIYYDMISLSNPYTIYHTE